MSKHSIYYNNVTCLTFNPLRIKAFFNYLEILHSIVKGDIYIVFLKNEKISVLNRKYYVKSEPTDVITFIGDKNMNFAGEIFLNIEYAYTFSSKCNKSFAEELTLYLVHGWLHLAGLRDTTETEKAQMRSAENKIMEALKKAKSIPDFSINKGNESSNFSKNLEESSSWL